MTVPPGARAELAAIKSISQRNLALLWLQQCHNGQLPSIDDLKPGPRQHDPKQLVIWAVEGEGRARQFRALYQGGNVAEVFNGSLAGRLLSDIAPPPLRAAVLDASHECVEGRSLVYHVIRTIDPSGRAIDCERLLLPLGSGGAVQYIMASLQLISLVGEYSRPTVLERFATTAECTVRLSIPAEQFTPA